VNFELSEDDAMLKALAERFVTDRYEGDARRGHDAEAQGFSSANWSLLGELGIIAGLGEHDALPVSAIAALFEAFGRGRVAEPLIENVVLAVRLFAATAPEPLRSDWLSDLLAGRRRIAVAHAEPNARPGCHSLATRAEFSQDQICLTGTKNCVPAGYGVDAFLVTANTCEDRPVLLFLPANTRGIHVVDWRMADGSTAISLTFDSVSLPRSCQLDGDLVALDQAQTFANLARGAEAIGIMDRVLSNTIEHLRTREQFGIKIGSFQAIQHRMAMQYAVIEQARGLLNLSIVSHGTAGFAQSVAGLRAFLGPASIELGHEAIQFHGGMGVTDELAIGHYHKRLLVLSRWPDDPDAALDRFAGVAA